MKFNEPSRPVTVTLPLRTLAQLQTVDPDRARAIAKAADIAVGTRSDASLEIELVEISPGASLLMVPPNQSLHTVPWLRMIELSPSRNLLSFTSGTSIEKVEIALIDLIEEAKSSLPHEVPLLEALREKFGHMRRRDMIQKAEILVVAEKA